MGITSLCSIRQDVRQRVNEPLYFFLLRSVAKGDAERILGTLLLRQDYGGRSTFRITQRENNVRAALLPFTADALCGNRNAGVVECKRYVFTLDIGERNIEHMWEAKFQLAVYHRVGQLFC